MRSVRGGDGSDGGVGSGGEGGGRVIGVRKSGF